MDKKERKLENETGQKYIIRAKEMGKKIIGIKEK